MCNISITNNNRPGLILEQWLHPEALVGTPYATVCANHTHREELWWSLRIYMTTAATTGARLAAIAYPSPSSVSGLTLPQVWGAMANGRGCMIDASGNRSRDCRFRIRGATNMLSNTTPPSPQNFLGYCTASFQVWLLQPPIGLTEGSELNIVVLGRCCLKRVNPIPGFALGQTPIMQNAPVIPSNKTPSWTFKCETVGGSLVNSRSVWFLNHTGDAWLAGGMYFQFADPWTDSPPAQDTGSTPKTTLQGAPRYGSVYVSDRTFPEWMNNNQVKAVPKFFAAFKSPISNTVSLVGFTNFEWAKNQAIGSTGMVPPGAEMCVSYHTTFFWGQAFPALAGSAVGANFYAIFDSQWPHGGPIYNTATIGSVSPVTFALPPPLYTTPSTGGFDTMLSPGPGLQPLPLVAPESPSMHSPEDAYTQPFMSNSSPATQQTPFSPGFTTSSEEWSQDEEEDLEESEDPLEGPSTLKPPLGTPPLPYAPTAPPAPSEQLRSQIHDVTKVLDSLTEQYQQALQQEGRDPVVQSPSPCPAVQQAIQEVMQTPTTHPDWLSMLRRTLETMTLHK